MTTVPTVKVTQPHIEQIHDLLDDALLELTHLHAKAGKPDSVELQKSIEQVDYLVRTATQYLPPRQTKLPF